MSKPSKQGCATSTHLPKGYEQVRVDADFQPLLPPAAAAVLRQELLRRQTEAEEQRVEEVNRRREELREEYRAKNGKPEGHEGKEGQEGKEPADKTARPTKSSALNPSPYPDEPGPGMYRVLPEIQSLIDQIDDPTVELRSADREATHRRTRILEKLVVKGPDRRIARAPDGRRAIDELEASLPHFRQPIRVLRNALALSDATGVPLRVPPLLLLGPPGVGKTHFSHKVAQMLGAPHAALAFDQPSAGGQLRGSDKFWANSETGLLFNLICMGEFANPVVLLDELDKSAGLGTRWDVNPLAQLHGVLEPETARRLVDVSVEIEFDASLVTYIATANSLQGLTLPILSRMQIFTIGPPSRDEAYEIAQAIVQQVLQRLVLTGQVSFERRAVCLLAHLSPRLMVRAVEQAAAAAVAQGKTTVSEDGLWGEIGAVGPGPRLH